MTTERALTKAKLLEINWDENNRVTVVGGDDQNENKNNLEVQFNPSSLKVAYSNQVENGGDNSASLQFVGRGDSKMSIELIFDVSGKEAGDRNDVRKITEKVAYFMRATPITQPAPANGNGNGAGNGSGNNENQTRFKVPGVRFQWGTFLFDGVMVSMDETLELWSETGQPLRATVSISLTQPGINFDFATMSNNASATSPPGQNNQAGTTPQTPVPSGSTLQDMVNQAGLAADWKAIAAANGIENPRALATGNLLNLQGGVGLNGAINGGLPQADLRAGASLRAGGKANASASVRLN